MRRPEVATPPPPTDGAPAGLILDYDQAVAGGVAAVGGKAWQLARLRRYGIPVPDGVVVSAAVLAELLIRIGEADGVRSETPEGAARLRAAIIAAPPTREEGDALRRAMVREGLDDALVAVRSSGTAEDGEVHSFAGLHHSELGVRGEAAIWRAVRACQASFWSERAMSYRRRVGASAIAHGGGVLICRMVGGADGVPTASGVLFTADPLGDADRLVVEAVAGRGDGLVSGRVTPVRGVYRVADDGWDAPPAFARLLDRSDADRLVRLALRVRDALADGDDLRSYDIEWALGAERLSILQARPVTTRPPDPVPGIAEIWSQANLIEVLPGVLSPLSWSLTRPGIRWTLLAPYRQARSAIAGRFALVKRIDGRPFLELSALQYLSYDRFGVLPAELNRSLGGTQSEISLRGLAGSRRDRIARRARALRHAARLIGLKRRLRPFFAECAAIADRCRPERLADADLPMLAARWRTIAGLSAAEALGPAAGAPVLWLTILQQVLAGKLDHDTILELVGLMVAGRGAIVSADHAEELAKLASVGDQRERDRLLRDFLDRYGHRGFDELELANPRWREVPDQLASVIDSLAKAPGSVVARRRAGDGGRLLAALRPLDRMIVKRLVDRIADASALREAARSESVRLLGALRELALEAGRRLTRAGHLSSRDEVFLLTIADLSSYFEEDWTGEGATALAVRRRALREAWLAGPRPPVVVTTRVGRTSDAAEDAGFGEAFHLRGSGVSPGIASGRACPLRSPLEAKRFRQGDILVAAATDPAWTPLFLLAGGIVVEHGGYLSHGAIVAREFGIPAVVDVTDALRRIPAGARVTLDGARGLIRLESEDADARGATR